MENINSNLVGLTDSEVQKRIDEGLSLIHI